MNYSRRALYAVGEPFGESATRREAGRRVVYGGGGSGNQTSTQNTSNVPLFAEQSFKDMLGRAEALSQSPYTPYQGERTAGFNPMQQQAQQAAAGQQVAPQVRQASGLAGAASMQALNAGQFQPGTFTPMGVQAPQLSNFQIGPAQQVGSGQVGAQQVQGPQLSNFQTGPAQQVNSGQVNAQGVQAAQTGFSPNIQQFQMDPAQQVGTGSFTQPGTAQQFMNPYMQNVVNIQSREAQRNADIAGTQRGADAVRAGGFGGSRQAVMDAEAQRNLSQQLGDIQATGSQAAFQQAQNQFNTEQGIGLQAQQANQQAGLTTGQQNLASNLNTQQLGVQTGAQTALANLGNQQQANIQNAANDLQSQGMNQDAGLRAGLANQQAGLTTGQQNLAAQLSTQQLGAQTGLQAQLANQESGLRAGLANQESGLRAGLANQQADLATDQSNLQSALGTQALGAQTGMQAQQSNQQALLDAQRAFEQSRQFGQQSGLQGAQTALQGANTLGQLGQQQFGQQLDITQQQNLLGGQQQALEQRNLDQQFGDFQNQQERPFQNVGFLSDILRGSGSTTRTVNPGPSALSQVTGAGVAAAGLGAFKAEGGTVSARGYAEGGEIEGARYAGGFAAGGITEPLALPDRLRTLSDQQLSQFAQQNKEDLFSMALAKSETDARARMRQMGAPTQAPQGTVMGEVSAEMAPQADPMAGGIAAGAPDMDFADGGIVGFAPGGDVSPARRSIVLPKGTTQQELAQAQMDAPDADISVEGAGAAFSNLMRAFSYSSDVEANKTKAQQQELAKSEATSDTLRNASRAANKAAPPSGAGQGIAAAVPPTRMPATPSASGGQGLAAAVRPKPAQGPQTAAELMAQSRELAGADAGEAKMRADQQEINALAAKGSEQDRADFEAEVAQRSVLGAEREKRLKTQEDRAEAGDKKSFNMALVEAGLAIMGGKSPNALTNIAEGAKAGVKGFQARLDKYETEKQRLDDARDRIDELRRAEGMADGKEKRLLGREIRATERTGKEALAKIHVDIFGATQKQAADATNTVFDRDAAAAAAAESAKTQRYVADRYGNRSAGGGPSNTAAIREQRMNLNSQLSVLRAKLAGERAAPFDANKAERMRTTQIDMDRIGSQLRMLGTEESQTPGPPFGEMKVR